jgi:hypothetical protein
MSCGNSSAPVRPPQTRSNYPPSAQNKKAGRLTSPTALCEFQRNLRRESRMSRETRSPSATTFVRKIQHNLRKRPGFQHNLRKGPSTQITGEWLCLSSVSSVRGKTLLNFFSTYVGIFGDSRVTLEFTPCSPTTSGMCRADSILHVSPPFSLPMHRLPDDFYQAAESSRPAASIPDHV